MSTSANSRSRSRSGWFAGVSRFVTFLAVGCVIALASIPAVAAPATPAQTAPSPATAITAGLYRVGIARADITPDYPIRLAGFGFRRTESEGVTQRIWAKALAVSHGDGSPIVLIAVDNCGIPAWMCDSLAQRLAASAKLTPDRLSISASHTHTGPMLKDSLITLFSVPIPDDHQQRIHRYSNELLDKLERVALDALADRRDATLHWGVGTVTFAKNRRAAGGPVDHDLPLLVARQPGGGVRAVLVNYACHCVTLSNNRIGNDWAGFATEAIEKDNPGAVALCAIGCGADQNPNSGVTGDKVDVAAAQGAEIAAEARRLLASPLAPLDGPIVARREAIDLPLAAHPTRAEWEERAKKSDAIGYHARVQLERLDRGVQLATKINYTIQSWSFGDRLAMVFLPGEVVVDYAKRLKLELDGRRLWVNSYSNGAPGYVPSERVLREGGYEGGGAMIYYDVPAPFAPGLEQPIIDTVRRLVGETFQSPRDPVKMQGVVPPSPHQSLAALRTKPGLTVELVVAEPLVVDPVAIDFGADGRMWVAEMHDYPSGIDGNWKPGGRVRLLRDMDGDGRYDLSTVFLDGLPFPTGVTAWRSGVLVCSAPDILYAVDTNDDGRADQVEKLYTGFGTGNFQARVNSLCYGLDGWAYGSCGLFGGQIETAGRDARLALGDRDFRIRPDARLIEPATGRTQQSRVRNDWGDWFGCDNSNLCRHYPLADHYLRRNPLVAPPAIQVNVADGPDSHRLFPIRSDAQRFKLSGPADRVTAACGLGVYRDELLGRDFNGDTFTCEPVNLVVHRLRLAAKDSSFVGRRADDEQDREFLASTDNWFRPVQALTGPDGALWVVDMCRHVIEHPRWIPAEDLERLDVRAGSTLGRIYRVRPSDVEARSRVDLSRLAGPDLAAALDTPNGWQRDMATQLLLWKFGENREVDPEFEPPALPEQARRRTERDATLAELQRLLRASPRAVTRLHALSALNELNALPSAMLVNAIDDPHPGVRRHAVRCAEPRIARKNDVGTLSPIRQALLDAIVRHARDDDAAQVRLQIACTLGASSQTSAAQALALIARQHGDDPFVVTAVLSSVRSDTVAMVLADVLKGAADPDPKRRPAETLVNRLLGLATAQADVEHLPKIARQIAARTNDKYEAWQFAALVGMLDALPRRGVKLESQPFGDASALVDQMIGTARATVVDSSADERARIAALALVGRQAERRQDDVKLLAELLSPRNSTELQAAAVAALGRIADPAVADVVVRNWSSHTPAMQSRVVDLLLSRDAWQRKLLDSLESRAIPASQIDAPRRQRLLAHKDAAVRARAERLFAGASNADRQRVVADYREAESLAGSRERGRPLFAKHCSACHRLGDVGHVVGPDLAALANKSAAFLLTEILDPNRNVDSRYLQYVASTDDGRTYTGLMASESATSLVLRGAEGKQFELLRSEIEQLQATGKSLMPEGLERDLTRQDLADLIALLSTAGPAPKKFEGNSPAVIRESDDGRLSLVAKSAEIYGGEIVFEQPFQNIGYWHGLQDHVAWRLELAAPGDFDVYLEYSCDAASAGNRFIVDLPGGALSGAVVATGGWDQFRALRIGTTKLSAGAHRVTLRPEGPSLRGALFDLRGVYLVPTGKPLVLTRPGQAGPTSDSPADIARFLLDDQRPAAARQELIAKHADKSAQLIAAMAADLAPARQETQPSQPNQPPQSTQSPKPQSEEYRRIPWIWRVAIAAGKRNDAAELRAILDVSLPQVDAPLRDWQAVVIGGGVVNGVSQAGAWPSARTAELLSGNEPLSRRWNAALERAAAMADDAKVPTGTRYDALRMIPLAGWTSSASQLKKYLAEGQHAELQMGAVSGLSDVDSPDVAPQLGGALGYLNATNRKLAIEALLRTESRVPALLDAIEQGRLKREQLADPHVAGLRELKSAELRARAAKLLDR